MPPGRPFHVAIKAHSCEKWQNASQHGDGFSSAESETLAPEQSSFCRGCGEGRVVLNSLKTRNRRPRHQAYCSYYRAYLLQKEPKNGGHRDYPPTQWLEPPWSHNACTSWEPDCLPLAFRRRPGCS
ncbi:hypothetical protein GGR58DRAFT_506748 [Xylaria digitata]|nr:hypothetical protein GGR58DRAFT_506748 [Xylaria digitata]